MSPVGEDIPLASGSRTSQSHRGRVWPHGPRPDSWPRKDRRV